VGEASVKKSSSSGSLGGHLVALIKAASGWEKGALGRGGGGGSASENGS
jgi:hypothetical protein